MWVAKRGNAVYGSVRFNGFCNKLTHRCWSSSSFVSTYPSLKNVRHKPRGLHLNKSSHMTFFLTFFSLYGIYWNYVFIYFITLMLILISVHPNFIIIFSTSTLPWVPVFILVMYDVYINIVVSIKNYYSRNNRKCRQLGLVCHRGTLFVHYITMICRLFKIRWIVGNVVYHNSPWITCWENTNLGVLKNM